LHGKDILHRDIKPANVFLSDSKAILGDFGLARTFEPSQTNLAVEGTLAYMAPEVFDKAIPTKASDVYSFGLLVWALCAGQEPYFDCGTKRFALEAKIQRHELPVIPETWPGEMRELITRCCALDSAQRPTMQKAYDRLNKYVQALEQQGQQYDVSAYQPPPPGGY
jgi:serine/threonine protein kinase